MVISDRSSPPPPPSPMLSGASRGVIAAVAPNGASDTIIQMILISMANLTAQAAHADSALWHACLRKLLRRSKAGANPLLSNKVFSNQLQPIPFISNF